MWLDMIKSTYVLQSQVIEPYYSKIIDDMNTRFPEVDTSAVQSLITNTDPEEVDENEDSTIV